MKQIAVMICVALVFVAAVAAEAATLRPEAVIAGDRVVLGDLFDGLPPDQAGVAIARAPEPGRQVTLDSRWLARIARAHGIDWIDASPYARLVVRRASHRLGHEVVAASLRAALAQRIAGDRIEIRFDGRAPELHLPIDTMPTVAVRDLSYDRATGRFVAALVAPADGPEVRRLPVSGRAVAVVEIPVLARRLRAGEVIGAGDIGYLEVSADRLSPDTALEPDELIGMSPRRAVAANSPVRLHDLRPPILIDRGDGVTMVLRSGALTISARGRALDRGGRGDLIRVVNVDSNRTIEAEITGPGVVAVRNGPFVASLN
ncbi:MAG: flagellar basal body P-ring formation chaperone FlgA [Alphaproteobacteria bacterium]